VLLSIKLHCFIPPFLTLLAEDHGAEKEIKKEEENSVAFSDPPERPNYLQ
jgi:hypothetical protein